MDPSRNLRSSVDEQELDDLLATHNDIENTEYINNFELSLLDGESIEENGVTWERDIVLQSFSPQNAPINSDDDVADFLYNSEVAKTEIYVKSPDYTASTEFNNMLTVNENSPDSPDVMICGVHKSSI